jgi:hypothetical protein
MAPTRYIAQRIRELVVGLGCQSVLNVGCGDDLWTPDLPAYTGVDVAPEAIERARAFHPERTYATHNVVESMPPGHHDLVIVRDVIQHLSFADGMVLLANIQNSGARWLLASTYTAASERHHDPLNVNIQTGDCYSPDITAAPFHMPTPMQMFPDGWDYDDPTILRDHTKWMGLWEL